MVIAEAATAHARRDPTAPALRWHGTTTSYGDLLRLAGAQRDRITALGLPHDEPIGVRAAKSPEAVALVLGALLAGQPFLLPSAALPTATLDALFAAAGCATVLTPEATTRSGEPGTVPGDTAFLLTTSGSTGLPKVVPLPGAGVARFTDWAAGRFGIGPGTAVLNYAPLNFDLCLLDVWTTLDRGGQVVLCDPARATDGKYLVRALETGVRVVQAVPMFYRLVADAAGGRVFDRVEHVVFTGDTIPDDDLAALPRLFPNARLHNVYGCTETNDSFAHEVDPRRLPTGGVPLGDPLPGVDALVVAPDGSVVEGPGSGELWVRTPFMTDGYLGAWAPADRFTGHPARPGGPPLYRTGDLVTRGADGHLRLRGRDDFRVKVRGVLVDPQEVERVLLAHPAVREAAVLARPAPTGGHALHAVLTRVPGSAVDSLGLRAHCARALAPNAIPSTLHLTDAPLPRTSTGKVDRGRVTAAPTEQETPCGTNGPSSSSSSTSSSPTSASTRSTPTTTSSPTG